MIIFSYKSTREDNKTTNLREENSCLVQNKTSSREESHTNELTACFVIF